MDDAPTSHDEAMGDAFDSSPGTYHSHDNSNKMLWDETRFLEVLMLGTQYYTNTMEKRLNRQMWNDKEIVHTLNASDVRKWLWERGMPFLHCFIAYASRDYGIAGKARVCDVAGLPA